MLKAFRIEAKNDNGEWVTVYETNNNRQRMIREKLNIDTTAIRLIPVNTYFQKNLAKLHTAVLRHISSHLK